MATATKPSKDVSGIVLCPPPETAECTGGLIATEAERGRLIQRLVERLRPFVTDLVLVADNPVEFLSFDALIVRPVPSLRGVLASLHKGLVSCDRPQALVVSWEQPLASTAVLAELKQTAMPQFDMIVPVLSGAPRHWPAVYAVRCHKRIEHLAAQQPECPERLFRKARLKALSEKRLRQIDPEFISFLNLLTPEDRPNLQQRLVRPVSTGN